VEPLIQRLDTPVEICYIYSQFGCQTFCRATWTLTYNDQTLVMQESLLSSQLFQSFEQMLSIMSFKYVGHGE